MSKCLYAICVACSLTLSAKAQITNHVRAVPGIYFELLNQAGEKTNVFQSGETISYILGTDGTNTMHFASLPKKQSFVFQLYGTNGYSVAKTVLGIQSSQSVNTMDILGRIKRNKPNLSEQQLTTALAHDLNLKHHYVSPIQAKLDEVFKPDEYFTLTNSGTYMLEVQIRLWAKTRNGYYDVILSDPVRVLVEKKVAERKAK